MDATGVTGVGIGRSKGKPIINIYVKEKKQELVEKLPKQIMGYKDLN